MLNLENICQKVCDTCVNVGEFILSESIKIKNSDIEVKGLHDFVTYVDKSSEKKIIESLLPLIPNAGFIAEENTLSTKGEEYNWIIDPLDGTTNFIHGVPCFAISIALMYKNELVLGVIYEINQKEMFYGWKNGGAYLNGKKISVSKNENLDKSLLATGFPYYDYQYINEYMDLFVYCMKNTRGLRRLGSAAVDLAYVACGRFEGFYEYGLRAWDVAAGAFLVAEAGGKVSDFSGNNDFIFGKEIIATNTPIFEEFSNIIKMHFKK